MGSGSTTVSNGAKCVSDRIRVEMSLDLRNDDASGDGHGSGADVVLKPFARQGTANGRRNLRQLCLMNACVQSRVDAEF